MDDLPEAVTLSMVQQATKQDQQLETLVRCIQKGKHLTNEPDLKEYLQRARLLGRCDATMGRLLTPNAELTPDMGTLRQNVADITHERHQGEVKCKQLFKQKSGSRNLTKRCRKKNQELPGLSNHHICFLQVNRSANQTPDCP